MPQLKRFGDLKHKCDSKIYEAEQITVETLVVVNTGTQI